MKQSLLVIALLASFASTSAMAQDTATVNATATVLANCQFVVDQGQLNFGALNPEINRNVGATTSLSYKCSKGTQSTVVVNNGLETSKLRSPNGSEILYVFSIDPDELSKVGTGFGGDALSLQVNAFVPYNSYKDVEPGTYTDSVLVTVSE